MNIRDYYNNKEEYSPSKQRVKNITELIGKDIKGKRILDIGCGNGKMGSALVVKGAVVAGCDISEHAVSIAKQSLQEVFVFDVANDNFSLLKKDFDIIIASELIEHLFSPEEFLLNIKSVMSKESSLILTTPNFLMWTNRIKMLLGRFRYTKVGFLDESHIHFFTYDSLRELLKQTGFIIEGEKHIIHPKIPNWLGIMRPNLFAFQLIIKVKLKK